MLTKIIVFLLAYLLIGTLSAFIGPAHDGKAKTGAEPK